jgi:phospholipase C
MLYLAVPRLDNAGMRVRSAAPSWASTVLALALSAGCGGPAPFSEPPLPTGSAIHHVVVIVQENHSFDNYFGGYCKAPAGTCKDTDPTCCEAAPAMDPAGTKWTALTDPENAGYDPDHTQVCELAEMHGGAMDRFTTGTSCADVRNFAVAPDDTVALYESYARQGALADRYFQPIVGMSSSNDLYLAQARYAFTDNEYKPVAIGGQCTLISKTIQYTTPSIADVLLGAGATFGMYMQGYAAMKAAGPVNCPAPPADCPAGLPFDPCDYESGDQPFQYYADLADNPKYMKDYDQLEGDLQAHTLPDVVFVKGLGYTDEHPGFGTTIMAGEQFVKGVVDAIDASPYGGVTLILLVWDEGGGYYDHVTPPRLTSPGSLVDGQPYGTRVPLIAIGPFARSGVVSHVTMEHSSIVKFLELNFTGQTGQLGGRDAVVANIGSLLDPSRTGLAIPSD